MIKRRNLPLYPHALHSGILLHQQPDSSFLFPEWTPSPVKRDYRNVGIVGYQNTFSGKYCKLTGLLREGGVLIGSEEKRLALVQDRGLPETIPASLLRNFCVTEFGVLTD